MFKIIRHNKLFHKLYLNDYVVSCFSQLAVMTEENKPLISCKRKEFDHYENTSYRKFEEIKLASKGWVHRKSKGDYFIIHSRTNTNEIYDNQPVTFNELGVSQEIIDSLKSLNIQIPTKIQSESLSQLLTGKNHLIAAETGCGKTLAYLIPAIQQILKWKKMFVERPLNSPLVLIISPSRELAHQIENVANNIVKDLQINTKVIIGGHTKRKMLNPEFEETDLLIATLGALSKLTTTGIYRMSHVHHCILDEADTLLDDTFNEKLKHFLKRMPFQYGGYSNESQSGTQLTLVSATMPTSLTEILGEIIPTESIVRITTDQLHQILPNVPQRFLRLGRADKPTQLLKMVKNDYVKQNPVMIFSNKSATCDWISLFLNENGINCINLNGNMHLMLRKGKFDQFQNNEVNVISCTDVGSRGLDTIRVKHVINYDFPLYTADYIHRCGRTGRIGSSQQCHVTNFISGQREVELVQKIEMAVRKMESLPNVNANIAAIIKHKMMRDLREHLEI